MNNNFFTTNKKFSKNDILIKNYIINHILDTKERNLILNKNELQKILILGSYDDAFEILNKFKDKYYIFNFDNLYGSFNILDGFYVENEICKFHISDIFYNIILNKKNHLSKFNINNLVKISNKNVLNLYLYINVHNKMNYKISISELKKIFEIDENMYQRFYDLEVNIIKPTLKELSNIINTDINYIKIKSGSSKNNKVLGIEIILNYNKKIDEIYNLSKKFNIKTDILNYYINKNSLNYVLDNLNYAINHNSNNLEEFIINSLENDYVNNRFNFKIKKYENHYSIIENITIFSKNILEYKQFLIKQLKKYNDNDTVSIVPFLNNIFNLISKNTILSSHLNSNTIYKNIFLALDNNKEFEFNIDNLIILGEYNENSESRICILEKNLQSS